MPGQITVSVPDSSGVMLHYYPYHQVRGIRQVGKHSYIALVEEMSVPGDAMADLYVPNSLRRISLEATVKEIKAPFEEERTFLVGSPDSYRNQISKPMQGQRRSWSGLGCWTYLLEPDYELPPWYSKRSFNKHTWPLPTDLIR